MSLDNYTDNELRLLLARLKTLRKRAIQRRLPNAYERLSLAITAIEKKLSIHVSDLALANTLEKRVNLLRGSVEENEGID